MFKRLEIDLIIRGYKLLYENLQHHNSRIYNRFILNEIVIIWKSDINNSLNMLEARNVLIKTKNNDKYNVLY